jgi:hypothetical protein
LRPCMVVFIFLAVPLALATQEPSPPVTPLAATAPAASSSPSAAQIGAAQKAVADSTQMLSNAKALEIQASTLINKWKGLPDAPSSTTQAIRTLEDIYQTMYDGTLGNGGLHAKLTSMSDSLKAQADALTSKQKDLLVGGATTPGDDVKDLFNQCDQVSKAAASEKTTLDSLATSLTDPLPRNYAFFTASFTAIHSSLSGLLDLKGRPDPLDAETVRQVLGSQLSGFASQLSDYPRLSAEWVKFSPTLAKYSASAGDAANLAKPVSDASAQVQTELNSILLELSSWFDVLSTAASAQTTTLAADHGKLVADYRSSYVGALTNDTKAKTLQSTLKSILDNWDRISAAMPIPSPQGLDADGLAKSVKKLHDAHVTFSTAIVTVEDDLSGNRSQWIADQVRLYYFTDVQRLLRILNPDVTEEGGVAEAADKAAAARKDLLNADLTLADAQADVNKYQTQLLNLKEQLRQAQAQQKSASFLFGKTSSLVNRLNDRLTSTQSDASQKSGDLNSTDPLKKAAAEQAKSKSDSLSSQRDSAKQANDNAQKQNDAAQQNLDTLQDQQQGLPAQIKAAQAALEDAQATVNKLRNAAIVAAQDESDAFAAARDHTPHLRTTPIGTSTDPARRVELFGFTDSKTIFIRGLKSDVDVVKGLIARFDQPSPQARITIWSLQLNSAGDPNNNKATLRFNGALSRMETELAATRGLVAASLSLLRETVSEHVNSDDVNKCAASISATEFNEESLRICRMKNFYEDEVLWRLAGNPTDIKAFGPVSRRSIPDPASVTTLGEALMVLSLAKKDLRQPILCEFEQKLKNTLSNLGLFTAEDFKHSKTNPLSAIESGGHFTLMEQALGISCGYTAILPVPGQFSDNEKALKAQIDAANQKLLSDENEIAKLGTTTATLDARVQLLEKSPPRKSGAPANSYVSQLTSRQSELVHALRARAAVNVQKSIDSLTARLSEAQSDLGRGQLSSLRRQALEAQKKTIQARLAPLLLFAYEKFNIRTDLAASLKRAAQDPATRDALVAQIDAGTSAATAEAFSTVDPLRMANARVAAADEMLKEIMIAVEDDLDRLFVHPMLDRLRADITKDKDLQVGVLQRTSILATNRLVARVDPRASAQLAAGEETDILQSLLQLGEVFVAARTGGPIAALNSLNAQKREAPPEIYALNTGSQLKVTPIFDPSGQALRFQFDYLSGTQIREPNGTTNRQLPRIERHAINTEVQISNMEMREISRFEANSKIGIPDTFWGGIPIIKDIPFIKDNPKVRAWFPLLGWFVRKRGEAAASQESVVFGQTTIYPTIADIADLLTSEDTGFGGN